MVFHLVHINPLNNVDSENPANQIATVCLVGKCNNAIKGGVEAISGHQGRIPIGTCLENCLAFV